MRTEHKQIQRESFKTVFYMPFASLLFSVILWKHQLYTKYYVKDQELQFQFEITYKSITSKTHNFLS